MFLINNPWHLRNYEFRTDTQVHFVHAPRANIAIAHIHRRKWWHFSWISITSIGHHHGLMGVWLVRRTWSEWFRDESWLHPKWRLIGMSNFGEGIRVVTFLLTSVTRRMANFDWNQNKDQKVQRDQEYNHEAHFLFEPDSVECVLSCSFLYTFPLNEKFSSPLFPTSAELMIELSTGELNQNETHQNPLTWFHKQAILISDIRFLHQESKDVVDVSCATLPLIPPTVSFSRISSF